MILMIEYRTKDGETHKYAEDNTDNLNELLSQGDVQDWQISQFVEERIEIMYHNHVKNIPDLANVLYAGIDHWAVS